MEESAVYFCDNFIEVACTHYHYPYSNFDDFWTHIELGAGNYGLDGHTSFSQNKTVLMALSYVSQAHNYIDRIEPYNADHNYDPYTQYALLFSTLEQQIMERGERGVFHINDLIPEYAEYAALQLKNFALSHGYNNIIIEAITGDYTKIEPQATLSKFGKTLYDSAHLKNPEISFYNYGLDGNNMLSNDASCANAREALQKLANLSHSGLYFFTIIHQNFMPPAEKINFIDNGKFYHKTNKYQPVDYYFPEGGTIDKRHSSVYFISPN